MQHDKIRLLVKRPIEVIQAILDAIGGDCTLSLEGDLSHCDPRGVPDISQDTKPDRVILPVNLQTKDIIKKQVLTTIGLRHRINSLSIHKNGVPVFAAYDNFGVDTVWVTTEISDEVLMSLEASAIASIVRL